VVLVAENTHNKVFDNLHPYIKHILPEITETHIFDKDLIYMQGISSTEDEIDLDDYHGEILDCEGNVIENYDPENRDCNSMDVATAIDIYVDELEKFDEDVFYISECC
jgi:hypothetical protein